MQLQDTLDDYYRNHYPGRFPEFVQRENLALLELVQHDKFILDVGCGNNYFRSKFKNLIGIDPANSLADYEETVEEFASRAVERSISKFDVAFCLGSINFGLEQNIIKQLKSLISLMKDTNKIYWRCNAGIDHSSTKYTKTKLDVFPWTMELHQTLSRQFGYRVVDSVWTNSTDKQQRVYAEWCR